MRAVLIGVVCMVGCYSPHYGDCEVACASNVCPSGLECHEGMCRVGGMTGACGIVPDAAGSGSGSDTGPVPLENLAETQRDALCDWLVRCRSFEDLASCRSAFTVQFQIDSIIAGVTAGKVAYDGNKARQCVDSFANSTCERARAFSNRDIDPVCNEVFRGTLPQQSQCYFNEECVSQNCSRGTNCPGQACCAGTCIGATAPGRPTIGQPCASRDTCVDSYCSTIAPSICTAYKASGTVCASSNECMPGLSCLPGLGDPTMMTCRAPVPTLGACSQTVECATLADVCLMNKCQPSGLSGTACFGSSDACQLSHFCSSSGTAAGMCQLPPGIGESCNTYPCREGYCSATGICTAKFPNGSNCDQASGFNQCESGYCDPTISQCAMRPVCT